MIHVYTGDGKGKTSAAFGLALRAAGAGFKIWIGQFLKGYKGSEHIALERFKDLITIEQFGMPHFVIKPTEEDIENARRGLIRVGEILTEDYSIIILDEVCNALHYNLFSYEELYEVIENRPDDCELILTGRNAPRALITIADLVTEMNEIKHYFYRGIEPRIGIEI